MSVTEDTLNTSFNLCFCSPSQQTVNDFIIGEGTCTRCQGRREDEFLPSVRHAPHHDSDESCSGKGGGFIGL